MGKQTGKKYYPCNGNHEPETYPFKNEESFYYNDKGHKTKVCRKKNM